MMIYLFTSNINLDSHYLYDDIEGYIIVYFPLREYSLKWKWSTDLDIYNDNPTDNMKLEYELPKKLVMCPLIINDGDLHKALCDRIEQIIFDKI